MVEPHSILTNYILSPSPTPHHELLICLNGCCCSLTAARFANSQSLSCKSSILFFSMAEFLRRKEDKAERTVRFRVASARSGRVLREVFREDASSGTDSVDSDATCTSEPERAVSPVTSEANGHLTGLCNLEPDDSGSDPDDLLMYASAKQEEHFSGKRVNIFSKNGTVRGVRDKVSAGQVLFNNLSKLYVGPLRTRPPRQRP